MLDILALLLRELGVLQKLERSSLAGDCLVLGNGRLGLSINILMGWYFSAG